MKDKQSVKTRATISECVWKTDEFDDPDTDQLKINSEVASDGDKDEFLRILRTVGVDPKKMYSSIVQKINEAPKAAPAGAVSSTKESGKKGSALEEFTRDLTESARAGFYQLPDAAMSAVRDFKKRTGSGLSSF